MSLTVWAVSPDKTRRGHLVPLECTAVLRDADVGTFSLTVPGSDALSLRVVEGWRVVIQDGPQTVLSGPVMEISESVTDKVRTLNGVSDLQHLADRRIYADPAKTWAQQTAEGTFKMSGPAAKVIDFLVHKNVGSGALTARQVDGFTLPVANGGNLGSVVTINDRGKPLLEECRKLARLGGVTFDAAQETNNLIAFRFRVPTDRSRQVRFSMQNGGLVDGTYSLVPPTVTAVLAAGKGTGTYLNMREHSRASSWGRRVEEFLDQASTDDDAEIKQAADEMLDDGRGGASATFKAQEIPGLRFGTDYLLGDIVTVEFGGATVSEPVRSVELTWDGHGRTASLTLGDHDQADDNTPAWVNKIKKLDARVRGMEVR